MTAPSLPPIVGADELTALRPGPAPLVVADVRWYLDGRRGRDAYRAGHLPGAVFVDLDAVLAGPPAPETGRHPLPTPAAFAAGLGAVGIGDDTVVVAYDDQGGSVAGRLVWMLRVLGSPAALLDGGLNAWTGARETGPGAAVAPARRTPRSWPTDRLAVADDVAGSPDRSPPTVVVDARAPERYRGEVEPIDARAGHVPGAVNLPGTGNLGPDGRFLDPAALRGRFAAVGITDGTDVVAYCGSGVSAFQGLLALERAGLGPGRLYPGSWSQWAADPSRPVVTGSEP